MTMSKRNRKLAENADLVIMVRTCKGSKELETVNIFDRRIGSSWPEDRIKERGCMYFGGLDDLKDTTNWCLNCDDSKYVFQWIIVGREYAVGKAYLTK